MPALGSDMEAGTLVAWRRKPGDHLQRGDIIAEVETDKGTIEVEVWSTGVLERYLVEPGQKVPVGTPLAVLRDDTNATAPVTPIEVPAVSRIRSSPAARKRARELGVDLAAVHATGSHGTITLDDVGRSVAATSVATPTAPTPPSVDRQRALRRAIATSMARSKREVPHYYLSTDINFAAASSWLERHNAEHGMHERLLAGVLLLKASAVAAKRMPEFNAFWTDDEARPGPNVHLGVAISLRGGGLVAPAIHDADGKSLVELMSALQDLTTRARAGSLRSSELSDATITVTSLGERGVETVFPIIYAPQTAIVGFGRITPRPWVVDGTLAVRPVVTATLAADHRATDGHLGARFLALIDTLLQEPAKL